MLYNSSTLREILFQLRAPTSIAPLTSMCLDVIMSHYDGDAAVQQEVAATSVHEAENAGSVAAVGLLSYLCNDCHFALPVKEALIAKLLKHMSGGHRELEAAMAIAAGVHSSPPKASGTKGWVLTRQLYDTLTGAAGVHRLNCSHCDFPAVEEALYQHLALQQRLDTVGGNKISPKNCSGAAASSVVADAAHLLSSAWEAMDTGPVAELASAGGLEGEIVHSAPGAVVELDFSDSSWASSSSGSSSIPFNFFVSLIEMCNRAAVERHLSGISAASEDCDRGDGFGGLRGEEGCSQWRRDATMTAANSSTAIPNVPRPVCVTTLLHVNLSHCHELTDDLLADTLCRFAAGLLWLDISHCSSLTGGEDRSDSAERDSIRRANLSLAADNGVSGSTFDGALGGGGALGAITADSCVFRCRIRHLELSRTQVSSAGINSLNRRVADAAHSRLSLPRLQHLGLGEVSGLESSFALDLAPPLTGHVGECSSCSCDNDAGLTSLDFSTMRSLEDEDAASMLSFAVVKNLNSLKLTDAGISDTTLRGMFGLVGAGTGNSEVSTKESAADLWGHSELRRAPEEQCASVQPLPLRTLDLSWCEELTTAGINAVLWRVAGHASPRVSPDAANLPPKQSDAGEQEQEQSQLTETSCLASLVQQMLQQPISQSNIGERCGSQGLSSVCLRSTQADSSTVRLLAATASAGLEELVLSRCCSIESGDIDAPSVRLLGERCVHLRHLDISWSMADDAAVIAVLRSCPAIEILCLQGCKHLTAGLVEALVAVNDKPAAAPLQPPDAASAGTVAEQPPPPPTGTRDEVTGTPSLLFPCTELTVLDFSWVNMLSKEGALCVSRARKAVHVVDYYAEVYVDGALVAEYL